MNLNLKKVFFGFVFGVSLLSLNAETPNVKDLVDSSNLSLLLRNSELKKVHDNNYTEFNYAIKNEFYSDLKNNKIKSFNAGFPFVYERLIYVKKSDILKASNSKKNDITISDVSKVMRSISKMQGMTYYSTTHKKYKVLYEKAYTIKGEKDKTKIADKTSGSANNMSLYCLQKDSSFGESIYRIDYKESENSLYAKFTVKNSMGFGLITAIKPNCLKMNIMITDCGDHLLMFIGTDADCSNFPGIKGKIVDSMNSRMDAVYNWFIKQF